MAFTAGAAATELPPRAPAAALTPGAYAASLALAGALAVVASRTLAARPPGGAARWERINHAGRPVTLLEGPALILAAGAGAAAAGALGADPVPALVASIGPGAAGLLDDLAGDGTSKGLGGHLRALRRGEVTTGAIKVLVLGASGVLAADRLRRREEAGAGSSDRRSGRDGRRVRARLGSQRRRRDRRGLAPLGSHLRGPDHRLARAVLGGAVIAGSANLANLLDLRPGRALKACLVAAGMLGIRADRALPGALVLGAGAGLLPADLAGRTMLGDGGANPAGALVGAALVAQTGARGQALALGLLTSLTLLSERVSFSAVIEATPGLREVDAWGRR